MGSRFHFPIGESDHFSAKNPMLSFTARYGWERLSRRASLRRTGRTLPNGRWLCFRVVVNVKTRHRSPNYGPVPDRTESNLWTHVKPAKRASATGPPVAFVALGLLLRNDRSRQRACWRVWRVEVVSVVIALTTGGPAVDELLHLSF